MRVVTADFRRCERRGHRARARFSARCSRRSATGWPKAALRRLGRRPLPEGFRVVDEARSRPPSEWEALRFAWRICAHVKSNTVIFTDATADAGGRRRADEPGGCRMNVAVMKALARPRESLAISRVGGGLRRAFFRLAILASTRSPHAGKRDGCRVQPGTGSVQDCQSSPPADEARPRDGRHLHRLPALQALSEVKVRKVIVVKVRGVRRSTRSWTHALREADVSVASVDHRRLRGQLRISRHADRRHRLSCRDAQPAIVLGFRARVRRSCGRPRPAGTSPSSTRRRSLPSSPRS